MREKRLFWRGFATRSLLPQRPNASVSFFSAALFACDAYILAEHFPTPVVICGPADNFQAPDEHVVLDDRTSSRPPTFISSRLVPGR